MIRNLVLVSFGVLLFLGCTSHCDWIKYEKGRKIGAVIEKKNVLEWNHDERLLTIRNYYNDDQGIYLVGEESGFFEYVQVGDSIYKESDSFKVKVYREGELKKVFTLDFYNDCGF